MLCDLNYLQRRSFYVLPREEDVFITTAVVGVNELTNKRTECVTWSNHSDSPESSCFPTWRHPHPHWASAGRVALLAVKVWCVRMVVMLNAGDLLIGWRLGLLVSDWWWNCILSIGWNTCLKCILFYLRLFTNHSHVLFCSLNSCSGQCSAPLLSNLIIHMRREGWQR